MLIVNVGAIALLFFSACSEPNAKGNKKGMIEDLSVKTENNILFVPDSTINNKLSLNDNASAETFFGKTTDIKLVDFIRESPIAIFTNRGQTEYLYAYQYEGSSKNSFSCFEIGYTEDNQAKDDINKLEVNNFITESGLRLGMSIDALVAVKGRGYKLKNYTLINYRIGDYPNNSFLQRYNMPEYFLECMLKESKVTRIKFGFVQP